MFESTYKKLDADQANQNEDIEQTIQKRKEDGHWLL